MKPLTVMQTSVIVGAGSDTLLDKRRGRRTSTDRTGFPVEAGEVRARARAGGARRHGRDSIDAREADRARR